MDEPTTMLSARVPINLIAKITNLAIDTNRTRTQVIVDALAAYIAPVRTDSDTAAALEVCQRNGDPIGAAYLKGVQDGQQEAHNG